MSNENLNRAKAAKNDEFYTQYADIEREMNAYLQYDPDVFRGKAVLLPCDDPTWSNFTKYFAQNFERLGLRKLMSTCFQKNGRGKIGIIEPGAALRWDYLEGDGDFRSDEVTRIRDEADFIITNPPFSLFREFFYWASAEGKKFILVSHQNAITYKSVFPRIKENEAWLGHGFKGGAGFFINRFYEDYAKASAREEGMIRVSGVVWFTNVHHGRRNQPLQLMTMADNLKFNKKMKGKTAYDRYDNYDAIEVPFTNAIPSDYDGVMGVPISFLDKYCTEQFEIIGFRKGDDDKDLSIQGKRPYSRILIRRIQ